MVTQVHIERMFYQRIKKILSEKKRRIKRLIKQILDQEEIK